jgi:lysophosphatidate acyltransferase
MLSNAIFMDRGNRTNAINQAKKAAEDMYRKKTSVWVYPEGTRSNADGPTLLPFKKGAFYMAAQAKAPIIPIVIENYKDIYNVKAKRFTHGDIKIKSKSCIGIECIAHIFFA